MKSGNPFAVVFVTAPNIKTARALARKALAARLIACANLVPRIESHYWWQGRLERSHEVLLILKTTKACLAELETVLRQHHPYDTPEILALPIGSGTERYLQWLADSCLVQPAPIRARKLKRSGG